MPTEIDYPNPKEPKQEGTAKSSIGALGLSVIIHGAVLLLVGGSVIFEGVIPRSVFNEIDGPVDPLAEEMIEPPLPEETIEMPDTPQPTDALAPTTHSSPTSDPLSSDIIISSAPSPNSFNLAPSANITAISNSASSITATKSNASEVRNPNSKQSVVQFFGIKAEARRVAFLMDASGSMVTAQRGGKAGYEHLKAELTRMVKNLDSSSEFNTFIFDSTVDAYKPRAVAASDRFKEEFANWITPYMSAKFGNLLNNYNSAKLKGYTGLTRMDLALTGAFEAGCDTIFILTDGTPSVKRPANEKEMAEWKQFMIDNAQAIEAHRAATKAYEEKHKALIAEMRAEIARRNAALEGRESEWIYWIEGYKGLPPRPKSTLPAGSSVSGPTVNVTKEEILDYLEKLYEDLYKAKNLDRPTIHVVGYSVTAKDREYLQQLAKRFGGNYRDFKSGD